MAALIPAIHVFLSCSKDVEKAGHDVFGQPAIDCRL
jgi:hypothetical protein